MLLVQDAGAFCQLREGRLTAIVRLVVDWEHGACTVREVLNLLEPKRKRAYTSVMSLMKVMADKGLLTQKPKGRAFVYSAKVSRDKTQSNMLSDLLNRAFDGSAHSLVAHLLEQAKPDSGELNEINKTITEFAKKKGGHDDNS